MSIETEISSLTTAIRNLTDVLLASAANALPTATVTENTTTAIRSATEAILASAAKSPTTATVTENTTTAICSATEAILAPALSPEPKKTVKKEAAPVPAPEPAPTPAPAPAPAPAPVPTVSEDDLRMQIIELARPNMADAAFKAFLGGKLSELQGAPCSISGTGKLPKIDAAHLPTLLAAINKQLGK